MNYIVDDNFLFHISCEKTFIPRTFPPGEAKNGKMVKQHLYFTHKNGFGIMEKLIFVSGIPLGFSNPL